MIKRTIKETISEYDEAGKLVRQTVTETTEDDNNIYYPAINPSYFPSDASKIAQPATLC